MCIDYFKVVHLYLLEIMLRIKILGGKVNL
jgi:hypothetical protein